MPDKAWKIDSTTLLFGTDEGKLSWWNFATQYPIHRNALTNLNIDVWDIPQLEIANKFSQNIFKLSLQVASIKDLERLPELDDQGHNQLRIYAKKLIEDIKLETQAALNSAEEMKIFIKKLSSSNCLLDLNMNDLEKGLTEVITYMTSLLSSLYEIELEIKTIFEWVDKLDGWKNFEVNSTVLYLFWVSYVINHYA